MADGNKKPEETQHSAGDHGKYFHHEDEGSAGNDKFPHRNKLLKRA